MNQKGLLTVIHKESFRLRLVIVRPRVSGCALNPRLGMVSLSDN